LTPKTAKPQKAANKPKTTRKIIELVNISLIAGKVCKCEALIRVLHLMDGC